MQKKLEQRQDLNPLERAKAYQQLIDEFSLTQDEVSHKVGQSRSAVANILRLLHLPNEMQQAIMEGKLTEGHAKVLLGISDPKARQQLFKKILEEGLSVRSVESEKKTNVRGHTRRQADVETRAREARLRDALGAKVTIKPAGKGGTISIHYGDAEELEGIVRTVEGK